MAGLLGRSTELRFANVLHESHCPLVSLDVGIQALIYFHADKLGAAMSPCSLHACCITMVLSS